MAPKRKISKDANGIVISVRFDKEIVEMVDLMTDNRSEFVREATWKEIDKRMTDE